MKIIRLLCVAAALVGICRSSFAEVISGSISNLADSQLFVISDGENSAEFYWSEAGVGTSGYVYAYTFTDVAIATGVTNISQIKDAGAFTFETDALDAVGPLLDAGANGGIAQFVILKNSNTGVFAVVSMDDVQNDGSLNATWWLQNDGSGDFSSAIPVSPLAQATDALVLPWTTSTAEGWILETTNTFDGVDAAQSGNITDDESTFIQTTVQGPGTLIFKWRASTEAGFDFFNYYIDDVFQTSISGDTGWLSRTNQIVAGAHTLRWEFVKDSSELGGFDHAYLDRVQFITPAAVVTNLTLRSLNGNAKVSFTTQPWRTNSIEVRTNVASGSWTVLTNVVGDGLLHTYSFPLGNLPQRYFRVGTQ